MNQGLERVVFGRWGWSDLYAVAALEFGQIERAVGGVDQHVDGRRFASPLFSQQPLGFCWRKAFCDKEIECSFCCHFQAALRV